MIKSNEDNTVIVLRKAIWKFKIKVSDTTIKDYLLTHPNYPTLKCVSDALRKWGIEHYNLRLNLDEIMDLDMPFIAHLNLSGGKLAFVEKIEMGNVTYSVDDGKYQNETYEIFAKKLSGAVIVLDEKKNTGEKEYRQIRQTEILNKILLQIGIFAILLFALSNLLITDTAIFYEPSKIFWGLLVAKIAGLYSSIFLVLHELKIHSPFSDKICGFSSKTDCKGVLTSNASRLFGWFNWADFGLIYFIGTLIYLSSTITGSSLSLLTILSISSLPYPFFSIYYQSVKLKKWCPFCLLIQLVLLTEFLILVPTLKSIVISEIDILKLFTSFFIPLVIWIIYKAYYESLINSEREHYLFTKFKRNPDIFQCLLQNNGRVEFSKNKNNLILGSHNAPITLTAFLSLNCNPCAKAFVQLKSLLDNCKGIININIVFSVYSDVETQNVINFLYCLYLEKGSDDTINFLLKWYSLPKESRKSLYFSETESERYSIAQKIGNKNKQLFEKYQVEGTPTIFLNGFKFPSQYAYSEVENFIDVIKKLT